MGRASVFRYTVIKLLTTDRLDRVPLADKGTLYEILAYKDTGKQ